MAGRLPAVTEEVAGRAARVPGSGPHGFCGLDNPRRRAAHERPELATVAQVHDADMPGGVAQQHLGVRQPGRLVELRARLHAPAALGLEVSHYHGVGVRELSGLAWRVAREQD